MAKENPGFEVVGGTEVEQPPAPDANKIALFMVQLGIKTLSQRALTAATDLFTLITVGLGFYLWMVTPDPNDKQIISLSIYAAFTLAANWIVRRK
jgi:hypothetical protein